MEKINFVKTFIPEGQYRQKYEYGNIIDTISMQHSITN